jgi:hypothetical protein
LASLAGGIAASIGHRSMEARLSQSEGGGIETNDAGGCHDRDGNNDGAMGTERMNELRRRMRRQREGGAELLDDRVMRRREAGNEAAAMLKGKKPIRCLGGGSKKSSNNPMDGCEVHHDSRSNLEVWSKDARWYCVPTASFARPPSVPSAWRLKSWSTTRHEKWQFSPWKLDGRGCRRTTLAEVSRKVVCQRRDIIMTEEMTGLIWKESPPGFAGVMYAEASYYCCTPLYHIIPDNGGFIVIGRWAMQHTPIIDGKVFKTLDEAKAAAGLAFDRFELSKPWSVLCDYDAYICDKLRRHHEPGCEYARRQHEAAAYE